MFVGIIELCTSWARNRKSFGLLRFFMLCIDDGYNRKQLIYKNLAPLSRLQANPYCFQSAIAHLIRTIFKITTYSIFAGTLFFKLKVI